MLYCQQISSLADYTLIVFVWFLYGYKGIYTWNLRNLNKFEHIFVAVITFSPFLLCKYFWYQLVAYCVCFKMICKCLYRHLFLEDISKHARVTQKWHFLICGRPNSQVPWAPRPKIGVRVAIALSCDTVKFFFFLPWKSPPPPPPPPELWCWEEAWSRLFSTPQLRMGGRGVHGKKKKIYCITAKSFSNPHSDFGARRSRRLGVRSATN